MGVVSDLLGAGGGGGGGKSGGALSKLKSRGSKKGGSSSASASASSSDSSNEMGQMDSYHSGGKVRKTGPARLMKGEVVLTKRQARRMRGRGGKSR